LKKGGVIGQESETEKTTNNVGDWIEGENLLSQREKWERARGNKEE